MRSGEAVEPVRRAVDVRCAPAAAFRLFTDGIDGWWPLATHSVGQANATGCVFEGRLGGRIYETRDEGAPRLWGTVTAWEPPHRIVFSWHPGRDASTAQEVELRFTDTGGGTRVELEHRGWEVLGERAAEIRNGYESGWAGVLALFAGSCDRP